MTVIGLATTLAVTAALTATSALTTTADATPAPHLSQASTGSVFTPTNPPARLLDTRDGGEPLGMDSTLTLPIADTAGVPATANAVVLTVTAINPTAGSFLTVYPDGTTQPATSNLDFTAGQTIANAVIVPLGTDGDIDIYNRNGSVDLSVDLSGYYATGTNGTFTTTTPTRILDTRNGTGTGGVIAPLGTSTALQLAVTGAGTGVPSTGVTAVVLNLTVTNPTTGSFLTVYPDGSARPATSNLNFAAGQTVANLVVVPVTDGTIDIWNLGGTTDVIADLVGYYTSGSGSTFTAAGPTRVLDTRTGAGTNGVIAPLGSNSVVAIQVTGTATGVPATATAVVLHLAATNATDGGFLTVYPDGTPQPITSNLDFTPGQVISNLVIVPVGTNGKIDIYNFSGTVDVIADLSGYYD